jgi:hypothetical protein
VVGAGALAVWAGATQLGGDEATTTSSPVRAESTPPLPELPRGGRVLFPDRRVVAFYGAPQDRALGTLGIGTPDAAGRRLAHVARRYARKSRPVLPAMELLATIANAAPGADGLYITRQPASVINRYLRAARRMKALLILDIQPGRADFGGEVTRLERWLREPDVGLALDPEWHVGPGQVPGKVIGSVHASVVNEVSARLAAIVRAGRLPQKLLLVHQFTPHMVTEPATLRQPPGIALTMDVDGFGDRPNKISKYDAFTEAPPRYNDGFKLFYEEDTNLMTPGAVLALTPPPDVVVYE